jgi:DNA-binding NarL/FixJ family response regulator
VGHGPEARVTEPIRVLLVDDDPLVRSGLKMMLAGAKQIAVVGEADDGRGVLAAVDLHHPDIVLMDIRMPRLDGVAATRLLRTQPRPPAVIVLTTFDADELVVRALQAGAEGFLLKDTAPTEIVRAIELVHAGEGSLSPAIARRLIALVAGDSAAGGRQQQARERLASLTAREHEVATAVGQGRSNADIAHELHMSLATVKSHVSRLLIKLNADNRVQIALLVQEATAGQSQRLRRRAGGLPWLLPVGDHPQVRGLAGCGAAGQPPALRLDAAGVA